jgi:hypothetical protein
VSVPSTATMGSGTITLKTSADNGANWFNVTGVPDLGAPGSGSQTITVAGTQLTAPVSGKTGFEVVLSGATGAVIAGTITCGNGSGSIAKVGASGAPGPTGPTGPPGSSGTPAAGQCIGVSTPPAAGTISYNCPTPGPQSTPSPSITVSPGPPAWTGTYPYTLALPPPPNPVIPTPAAYATTLPNGSQEVVATVGITTGVSLGPVGGWQIEIWQSDAGSATHSMCIVSTTAGTGGAGTSSTTTTPCSTTPSGALAGTSGALNPVTAFWTAQYANSTTYSFNCQDFDSFAATTVRGVCYVKALPI